MALQVAAAGVPEEAIRAILRWQPSDARRKGSPTQRRPPVAARAGNVQPRPSRPASRRPPSDWQLAQAVRGMAGSKLKQAFLLEALASVAGVTSSS